MPVLDGGKCLAIARIKDGSLIELADMFLRKVKPEWLPSEAIILIFSPSHMARIGTSAYAEEYVTAKNRLKSELPETCLVLHAPVLMLGGCNDPPPDPVPL